MTELDKLLAFMRKHGFSTGHADDFDMALAELNYQISESKGNFEELDREIHRLKKNPNADLVEVLFLSDKDAKNLPDLNGIPQYIVCENNIPAFWPKLETGKTCQIYITLPK